MKIYYAHSIRGSHSEQEWTPQDIIPFLQSRGHEVLSEEIYTTQGLLTNDEKIYQRDISMINECNIVLANCTNPSLGVGYELGYAESQHKPIICFYQQSITNKISAMVTGNSYFTTHAIENIEELKDIIIN